ncbi:MAG: hypothetical protein A3J74_08185 [Elusimicrobia bacterium RIFCSPHIGHO2_02_FULL_57_9]|nr:MAG: hypothetical protein A3J74_08185 [Elusimicrobia bacterium RIFCSPHIGHO2_02_FULL_57_9]
MTPSEFALLFLAEQRPKDIKWGAPVSVSISVHGLLLLMFLFAWEMEFFKVAPPIKVLEIGLMGDQDLALRGMGNDFNAGPMPDKEAMTAPSEKPKGKVTAGNTARISRSVTKGESAANIQAAAVPAQLTPRGALFGGGTASNEGTGSGIGRKKVYLAGSVSAVAMAGGSKKSGGGDGEGLAGIPGQIIDLNAKRGGGGGGDGHAGGSGPGGNGRFLGGGDGSRSGGNVLQRKGQSILADYPSVTQEALTHRKEKVQVPEPSDAFFSITGPLSHRKIISIKLPKYPRWAEESGLEAQISIRLTVTPNGKVKSNLFIEQTSGYPEFDQLVLDSVAGIRFAPLERQEFVEEWGVATFNFRLKATGGKI